MVLLIIYVLGLVFFIGGYAMSDAKVTVSNIYKIVFWPITFPLTIIEHFEGKI